MNPPLQNVLSKAKSPYLLQHATNPVAWQEWNSESIARAKAEDKPIFLSVGYSACHWCHVLAHESFENDITAKAMNESFVNIKVDREERPDVDRVYMTYLQATTGRGGWPMSVWLTPDLDPIFAGTYFPVGRFRSYIAKIAEVWEENKDRCVENAKEVMKQLQEMQDTRGATSSNSIASIATSAPQKLFTNLSERYEPIYGGFSESGPKFPSPSQTLTFLARHAYYSSKLEGESSKDQGRKSAEMGYRVLRALWEGGVRDWVGGGVARYSVDEKWRIPHFEKMLYDQAQVCSAALDFSILPNLPTPESAELCQRLAADILEYTCRDLRSPEGGFYSAEDADSAETFEDPKHTSEGAFYVWTKKEFDEVLGDDSPVAAMFYGVKLDGNVDPQHDVQGELVGKCTLFQDHTREEVAAHFKLPLDSIDEKLNVATTKLKAYRDKTRPRPHLDDKILTGWNGLMISALAQASMSLPLAKYPIVADTLKYAEAAVAFIKRELYDDSTGTLTRSWREGKGPAGQSDDYAFLIKGLLDLYDATTKEEYVLFAIKLQDKQNELFFDEEGGGYFASAPDPHILVRMKDSQDGAEPAASSITLLNLQRLALLASSKNEEYLQKAEESYESNSAMLEQVPHAFATSVAAMVDMDHGYKEYIITGSPSAPFVKAIRSHLDSHYQPNKIVIYIDPENPPTGLASVNTVVEELIASLQKNPTKPSLRICEDFACQLPVYEVEEATTMLDM